MRRRSIYRDVFHVPIEFRDMHNEIDADQLTNLY